MYLPAVFADSMVDAAGRIDAILAADWEKNGVEPNPRVSDEVFLRRVSLDVIGRIPTWGETVNFLESTGPEKRASLIDELLASEGYAQHFYIFWSDILRGKSSAPGGVTITTAYLNYIRDSLRENVPYDKFARGLVGAQGSAWNSPGVGYYMRDRGMPLDNFANTARVFLGTRIECAQCHDHPFDKWTQMDFFRMAAFSSGVTTGDLPGGILARMSELRQERGEQAAAERKAKGIKRSPEEYARDLARYKDYSKALTIAGTPLRYSFVGFRERPLLLPRDYQYDDAKPREPIGAMTMIGEVIEGEPGENLLKEYAGWMTSPENPRFTTVIVNRLWKKFFGLGLIDPLDDLTEDSRAVNPELMTYLETLMIELNYDMKAFLRVLLNTRAYQGAVSREADLDDAKAYRFTGPLLRRMTAEQIWDSFVALVNPTPEMTNPESAEGRNRILKMKKLSDALELMSPDEIDAALAKVVEKIHAMKKRRTGLAAEMEAARKAGDIAGAKKAKERISFLEIGPRTVVNDHLYAPALQRLARKRGVADAPLVLSRFTENDEDKEGFSLKKAMNFAAVEEVIIPGYEPAGRSREEIRRRAREREDRWLKEAAEHGFTGKFRNSYVSYRKSITSDWLRAAELSSPAPRGHFLREFGQSDRELIENANPDASIPQALALMNGTLLPRLVDPVSPLMLSLRDAETADARAEAIYLTLLSRRPTEREKAVWAKARENGLTEAEDLIFAVLNGRQFLFIQ